MPNQETSAPLQVVGTRLTIVAAAAAALVVSLTLPMPAGVGIGAAITLLARAAEVDHATHRIPNRPLIAATAFLAGAAALTGRNAVFAAAAIGALWLIPLLALHLVDPHLGFGDVKLGGVLGAMIGLACTSTDWDIGHGAIASSVAFVLGGLLTLLSGRRGRTKLRIPFAPGLVTAVAAVTVTIAVMG